MIRAPMGNEKYWEHWASYDQARLKKEWAMLGQNFANALYKAQYAFDTSWESTKVIFRRYSRGDSIRDLCVHFCGILDAWELSNKLSDEICAEHKLEKCRDWTFALSNLNHYNRCFWLVGLALSLEIPDDQWQRLLALINGEGEDLLLDRIIASREPGRTIGEKLLHKKPYARLLKAIDAPQEQQAELLQAFVENWYAELARKGNNQLWWYIYGDPEKHPLEMGSYFGRWCVEAVAAVKAFGLDDSLCLGHEHYPGDLLRPDGPTTHPERPDLKPGLLARLFGRKSS